MNTTREDWQREDGVECVICPDCAFTFDAFHSDADDLYSCPVCAEARLRDGLRRHGKHLGWCDVENGGAECSCGFHALLSASQAQPSADRPATQGQDTKETA